MSNQREIENLKTLIDKLLRKGDIIDIILFVQNRINYKITQITQIDELLYALPSLIKKANAVPHPVSDSIIYNHSVQHGQLLGEVLSSPPEPKGGFVFAHPSNVPHTTDCVPQSNGNTVRLRPPMRLPISKSKSFSTIDPLSPQPLVTSEDFLRYKNAILRAFNLKKEDFEENTDNCQEEIRDQLEKQKSVFNKEVEKLKALMPNHVRKKRVGSPAP